MRPHTTNSEGIGLDSVEAHDEGPTVEYDGYTCRMTPLAALRGDFDGAIIHQLTSQHSWVWRENSMEMDDALQIMRMQCAKAMKNFTPGTMSPLNFICRTVMFSVRLLGCHSQTVHRPRNSATKTSVRVLYERPWDEVDRQTPEDNVIEMDRARKLRALGAQLPYREGFIFRGWLPVRWGGRGMTLTAMGRELGVTRERVRQIRNSALGKIQEWARQEGYHEQG